MQTITLVTGNKAKLREWQRLFPPDTKLEAADIDLDEIQSLDLEAIVIDKAKRAFDVIGKPVIVEDVSAGLNSLHGLPGPFIKYFEVQLGADALYKLAQDADKTALVTCTIAYYDGERSITARGDIHGSVVSPRGSNGFGFDHVFMPDGVKQTFSEMDSITKDSISHRGVAIKELVKQLQQLNMSTK